MAAAARGISADIAMPAALTEVHPGITASTVRVVTGGCAGPSANGSRSPAGGGPVSVSSALARVKRWAAHDRTVSASSQLRPYSRTPARPCARAPYRQ